MKKLQNMNKKRKFDYDTRYDTRQNHAYVSSLYHSLVLGNLFQLTYNAVDSIIVGHFVGKEALAAVGICIQSRHYSSYF